MKPTIALVGRPNVGKSTLFNRLTRSKDALVADLPGLTRDRHYGEGRMGERPFLVIDTGGFEPVVKEGILHQMALQTKQAVAEADVVVFIVDGEQARQRSVTLGRTLGDDREVLQGLAGGDNVILDPSEKLVDGARVRLAREESDADANNE